MLGKEDKSDPKGETIAARYTLALACFGSFELGGEPHH
jgi:hypothetical protein